MAWCPWQSGMLATGGGTNDKCIKIWNTANGQCLNSVDTKSQVSLSHRENDPFLLAYQISWLSAKKCWCTLSIHHGTHKFASWTSVVTCKDNSQQEVWVCLVLAGRASLVFICYCGAKRESGVLNDTYCHWSAWGHLVFVNCAIAFLSCQKAGILGWRVI